MDDQPEGVLIDASLRFARSNPALLAYAEEHASPTGASVDELLAGAVARVAAAREAAAERAERVRLQQRRGA